VIRNENIALGLAILSHYLKRRKKETFPAADSGARTNPPQALIDIFARYQPKREFLVRILEDTQRTFGYLSQDAIGYIADFLNITREKVLETAAFYPMFRTEPLARYRISLCRGETCTKNGAQDLLEAVGKTLSISSGEATPDGMFSLETAPCRGMCAHGPIVSINDRILEVKNGDELARELRALLSASKQDRAY
jgi:NADH:ubiquinone oxidoreductase subunit E